MGGRQGARSAADQDVKVSSTSSPVVSARATRSRRAPRARTRPSRSATTCAGRCPGSARSPAPSGRRSCRAARRTPPRSRSRRTTTTGSVPSTANVPASTSPAEVITPPVAASPISAPRRVPYALAPPRAPGSSGRCCSRCPARPGTRRRTAGSEVSAPAKPNTWSKSSALTPERGGERQHHGRDQHQRRDHRPQQQQRGSGSTTSSTSGMISPGRRGRGALARPG